MKHLILAAVLAAVPLAAMADDASALLEKVNPVCGKPTAQLTVAQIEECRTQLRMLSHFVGAVQDAVDARNRDRGVRVFRPEQ